MSSVDFLTLNSTVLPSPSEVTDKVTEPRRQQHCKLIFNLFHNTVAGSSQNRCIDVFVDQMWEGQRRQRTVDEQQISNGTFGGYSKFKPRTTPLSRTVPPSASCLRCLTSCTPRFYVLHPVKLPEPIISAQQLR
jgi:hypothetical protein